MTSFILNRLKRATAEAERGWPMYMFGGRVRTSTLVLVIAFLAVWWLYNDHQQATKSTKTTQVPATQVVPPGFVPDPNYTWVPRSRLQAPPKTVTVTQTPTSTPPPPTTTSTAPPLIPPIVLPPPFGPPTTTTAPAPAPPPAPPPAPGFR